MSSTSLCACLLPTQLRELYFSDNGIVALPAMPAALEILHTSNEVNTASSQNFYQLKFNEWAIPNLGIGNKTSGRAIL